jgi:hypothetical protein
MPDTSLIKVRLNGEDLPAAASWAHGLDIMLPTNMAALIGHGGVNWDDGAVQSQAQASALHLRERNAYLSRPPTSARLPVNYRAIPGPLRRAIGRGIGRMQRYRQSQWASFPGWPVDLSADAAADLGGLPFQRPARTPVLLTHDIDSAEGLANLVRWFLPIEEANGARSANYVVPCAWPIDRDLTAEIAHRGHEIGIHGYDHSNRTPFAPAAERHARLAAGAQVGAEYKTAGYRAPSLVRTKVMIEELASHYRYDSSIPTSGGLFPVPNNGCASARPWRIGTMWELPLSMPRDGSLQFLGYSPARILSTWIRAAQLIASSGGIVCLLTHCERGFSGNPPMLKIYREFIEQIAADNSFEFLRPIDLVERLDRRSA